MPFAERSLIALPSSGAMCGRWPYHRGFAPLGACHWQCLANLAARAGVAHAPSIFGASVGITWPGSSALLGGDRWRANLRSIWEIEVEERTAPAWPEALAMEEAWWRQGVSYVAEVDPVYLPWWRKPEHLVHAVIVVGLAKGGVRIVDPMAHPRAAVLGADSYRQLRSAPAAGRTGLYKCYVLLIDTIVPADPESIIQRLRADVAEYGRDDAHHLAEFISWVEDDAGAVDVCRVAAERHQATLLFDRLREDGVAAASACASTARAARDAWYLIHLLSAAGAAADARRQRRVVRLLRSAETIENELRGAMAG
jgi:hypothetical protein